MGKYYSLITVETRSGLVNEPSIAYAVLLPLRPRSYQGEPEPLDHHGLCESLQVAVAAIFEEGLEVN